jgi:predicted nucleic acid-binding protein
VRLKRVAVDSDIILDHLHGSASPSVLRRLLGVFFCYTTVFQAAEVISRARTPSEVEAMQDAMGAIKLLGVNGRGATFYGQLLRKFGTRDRWTVMVAGLCLESRLPLVTGRSREYRRFPGLLVVGPRLIRPGASGEEILNAARARG